MVKYVLIAVLLILFFTASGAPAQAQDTEPIAYIGHGGFFDQNGKQIEPTVEFVEKAQAWYCRGCWRA